MQGRNYTVREGRRDCCGKPMWVQTTWKRADGTEKCSFYCSVCGNTHKEADVRDRIMKIERPLCCGKPVGSRGSKQLKKEKIIKRHFKCMECGKVQALYYNQDNTLCESQHIRRKYPVSTTVQDTKAERIARKIAEKEEREKKKQEAKLSYFEPDPIPTPQLDPMMLWGLSMETRRNLSTNHRGLRI